MRTAIYVYEPADVVIEVTSKTKLSLEEMNAGIRELASSNQFKLAPGIYKIVSDDKVIVRADDKAVTVETTGNNKDPWPQVPPLRGFAGATLSAVQTFFEVAGAKGIDSLHKS